MFTHLFKRAEQAIGIKLAAGFFFMASMAFILFALHQWLRVSLMLSSPAAALVTGVVSSVFALLMYFSDSHFSDKRYDKLYNIEVEIEKVVLTFLENLLHQESSNDARGKADSNKENVSPFSPDPGRSSRV